MRALSTLLPLLRLHNLLFRFSPLGHLPVVLPLSLLVRLLNPWRISFVLWIFSVPLWTLLKLGRFVLGWFLSPVPVPSEPVLTSHRALAGIGG